MNKIVNFLLGFTLFVGIYSLVWALTANLQTKSLEKKLHCAYKNQDITSKEYLDGLRTVRKIEEMQDSGVVIFYQNHFAD